MPSCNMFQPHAVKLRIIFLVVLVLAIVVNCIILFTSTCTPIVSSLPARNALNISSINSKNENFYRHHGKNNSNVILSDTKHTVVIFNAPDWWPKRVIDVYMANTCSYRNCRVTYSHYNLRYQSAVLFSLNEFPFLPQTPPISPFNRSCDQVWIFKWTEAPSQHRKQWGTYKNQHWRNTPNWTMSYSDNSDIVCPYGYIRKRTPPSKNYSEIFHRKTHVAAWVVSHCHTNSLREEYVRIMREKGIAVDIYGECADKRVDEKEILNMIDRKYKFYLSFENNICKDYITEKFYKYLQLDVVLIVRGGGNYSKLLPSNAYINTVDFSSIADLAAYLKTVSTSEQRYTTYLRNKDGYESIRPVDRGLGLCEICEKLNNLDQNRNVYKHTHLIDQIHDGTCEQPSDIH